MVLSLRGVESAGDRAYVDSARFLKMMFNSVFNKLVLALFALLLLSPGPAEAQVFYTVRQLLSEQFKSSERVDFKRVAVDKGLRKQVEGKLGRRLPKANYTFYVASSAGQVDGYALFDEQLGQHEMISFATFFDAQGRITRVEVVAYREPYGDGIRTRRFRQQFLGRDATSGFRPNRDIDAVSGATISSESMCVGVRRASLLLAATVLKRGSQVLAAR